MKYRFLFFFVFLFHFSLQAQVDTKGTDFWLTFGRNSSTAYGTVSLQIRIVGGDQPATGIIHFTSLGTSVPFSIAAGQVFPHNLSSTEFAAAMNITAGKTNFSVRITSSAPVTVYALNQQSATTDATNILPVTAYGTEYYQISYTPLSGRNDAYAVIATENLTQVYHNNVLVDTLNAGQVYYRTSTADMSGSYITTDKPTAFFALSGGTNIPVGYSAADIMFQQLAPVNTWGKSFFVPVSHLTRDVVRIMASQNATTITQTGGTILQGSLTLNAGQFVDLIVYRSNNGCYIEADKPVGVCAYLTGQAYNGNALGSDPAQAWVPSIEQTIKSALIAPFNPVGSTNLNAHYALIISPTATKNSTTMKIGTGLDLPLSGGTWFDNATAGMSFYAIQLTNTLSSYIFTNLDGGLIVMGYGTGSAESYYYLASSGMRSLDAAFYVNDIHYQDVDSEVFCKNDSLHFRAEIFGDLSTNPGFLKWYIDNVEQVAIRDLYTWDTVLPPATYQVKIIVLMDDNITTKTVESSLTVVSVATPVISPAGIIDVCLPATSLLLSTSGGDSYQWFRDGSPLAGAIYNTYNATVTGEYSVISFVGNCSSEMSDTVTVLIGGFLQANNDYSQAVVNTPVQIPLLGNDSLACCGIGGITGPTIVTGESAKHGTATISGNILTYTSDVGYTGQDSLMYYIKCGADSSAAKVFINVTAFPDNIVDTDCYGTPPVIDWDYKLLMMSPPEDVVNYYSIPLAGDIDNDGKIEIIAPAANAPSYTVYSNAMYIFEVDGVTMKRQQKLDVPIFNLISNSYAIANVDGGSYAALFIATAVTGNTTADQGQLIKYVYNGMQYVESWRRTYSGMNTRESPQPMIVDFNNDGTAEVLVYDKIFNAVTGDLLVDPGYLSDTTKGFGFGGHAVSGVSGWTPSVPFALGSMMAVTDIDGDGIPEVIGGNCVYKITIVNPTGTVGNSFTLYREADNTGRPEVMDGATAVADMDGDSFPDVIVTTSPSTGANAALYIWNPRTGAIMNSNTINNIPRTMNNGPNPHGISVAFIGDIDNDSLPEICLTGMNVMRAYDYDAATRLLSQKWNRATTDNSGATTMVMFDFDQDGMTELVYRDQTNLRIINGIDGTDKIVSSINCYSSTGNEYPIVVDVNSDGAAELVVSGATTNSASTGRIMVFSSMTTQDKWAPTRKVWNQFAYNVVNINDDLTVPLVQMNPGTFFPNGKQPFNGYLQQQTLLSKDGDPLWILPDVITDISLVESTVSGNAVTVTVGVVNQRDAAMGAPIYVALYKDYISADTIATGFRDTTLMTGDTVYVTVYIPDITSLLPFANIVIRLNDNGIVFPVQAECDTTNNKLTIPNPVMHLMMKKYATLFITPTDSIEHNGFYSNPVSVLHGEEIQYRIEAINASLTTQNVIISDTVPAWLDYVSGSSDPPTTPLPVGLNPSRDELSWSISTAPMDTAVVTFRAKPHPDVYISISQPLYANRAWVTVNGVTVPTNYTWHQGAGVSVVTFSAGFGGIIYQAKEQVLDYRTSPRSGIVIAPDEGYRFAGWSHAEYRSLRGALIPAKQGIMRYDTLTIYGNVTLHADFEPEAYAITYYLNGGEFKKDGKVASPNSLLPQSNPFPISYTIESTAITLTAPEKTGDVFTGWTGSNGDEPQPEVTIPHGSTGEKIYFANYLHSGREGIDLQPLSIPSNDLIWTVKNELFVRTTYAGSILRIYTLDGVLERQQMILQPGETRYKLAAGLYIVTLNNGIGQKVIVSD